MHSTDTLSLTARLSVRGRADNRFGEPHHAPTVTWFGIGVRKLKSQTGNREFGTANAVSRAVTEAPPCPPAASRAGDATGLVRCAGTMCARDGRLPAFS